MSGDTDKLAQIEARARQQAGELGDDNVWNVLARDVLALVELAADRLSQLSLLTES